MFFPYLYNDSTMNSLHIGTIFFFTLVFHLITTRDDYYGDDAGINNLFYPGHYFANVQILLRDETGKTNVSSLEFVI